MDKFETSKGTEGIFTSLLFKVFLCLPYSWFLCLDSSSSQGFDQRPARWSCIDCTP